MKYFVNIILILQSMSLTLILSQYVHRMLHFPVWYFLSYFCLQMYYQDQQAGDRWTEQRICFRTYFVFSCNSILSVSHLIAASSLHFKIPKISTAIITFYWVLQSSYIFHVNILSLRSSLRLVSQACSLILARLVSLIHILPQ